MNSCSGLFGEASAPHSASILKSKTAGLSTSWHASCMLDIYNRSSLINPMIESIHLKFHYTTLFLNDDGRVQEYIFRKKKGARISIRKRQRLHATDTIESVNVRMGSRNLVSLRPATTACVL
jgi:hypothetical protein